MINNSNNDRDNTTINLPAYLTNRNIISISTECDRTVLHIRFKAVNIFTNKRQTGHIICSFYRNDIDKTLGAFLSKSDDLDVLTKDNRLDKSLSHAVAEFIESNWPVLRG